MMTNEEYRIVKSLKSGVWGEAPLDNGLTIDDLVAMKSIRKMPPNTKKINSEIVSNGITLVKVAENPTRWKRKQLAIYEQAYGKIPKGYNVLSLTQDKNDFNLDNLILVKKGEITICNRKNLLSNDKELSKLGLLTAQLIKKTNERKRDFSE